MRELFSALALLAAEYYRQDEEDGIRKYLRMVKK